MEPLVLSGEYQNHGSTWSSLGSPRFLIYFLLTKGEQAAQLHLRSHPRWWWGLVYWLSGPALFWDMTSGSGALSPEWHTFADCWLTVPVKDLSECKILLQSSVSECATYSDKDRDHLSRVVVLIGRSVTEGVNNWLPQLGFFMVVPSRIYLVSSTFWPTMTFHTLLCDLGLLKKGRFHCWTSFFFFFLNHHLSGLF